MLAQADLTTLAAWAAARSGDAHLIGEWVRLREMANGLSRESLERIFEELVERQLGVDEARDAFLTRFYRAWLDAVHAGDDSLRGFGTDAHERLIDEFRALDRDSIRLAHTRIRQRLLNDPSRPDAAAGDAPGSSELRTIGRRGLMSRHGVRVFLSRPFHMGGPSGSLIFQSSFMDARRPA